MAFSYAGTGRILPFRSEDLFGILSYSYSPSTGDPFYYLDYGSVAEPPIDSWVIANHANETIQSLANDRIIDLVYSGTGNYIDLGSINEIEAVSQDDWGLITTSSDVFSFGTLKLVSLPTWSVHKVWVGTGQIWERGRAITRLIAPYQASGTLRLSGLSTTFYVPSIATDGILPFRSFTTQRTLVHELGTGSLKKFSGAAEAVTFNSEERQLLFSVNGNSDIRSTSNLDGSGIVSVDGTLDERYTPSYTGTGRLPSVSSLDERRTYNYDGVSHDLFVYKDFGSITSPVIDSWVIQNHANETIQSLAGDRIIDLVYSTTGGQYLDFQSILIDGQDPLETVVEDWEYIWQGDSSRYAMGLWSLKGTAKQNFVPNWNGSGTLFGFGNGIGRVKPRWIAYIETKITGAAKTNFSLLANGGGHLFTLSNGEQRRTFDYEGTGYISTISGASESISSNPEERQLLFDITGSGHEIFTPNWNGFGTIPFTGHLSERQTDHWWGSGTLFNFSGGQENVVYDYNPLSHAIFEKRDYGSVSSPVIDSWVIASHANETIQSLANDKIIDLVYSTTTGQYLDFKSILIDGQDAPETVREDWEYIWQGTTRYAFGDLTIGGAAKTNFSLSHYGSGTIKLWVWGWGRTKPRWVAFVHERISGQATESTVKRSTGSGTLFNFAKADENRTYGYIGSGELYAVSGAAESTGATPPEITTHLKISGSAHEIFTPNWNSEGTLPFTGYAVERKTDHWAGSGSLWSWSGGQEVRTYDYNPLSHAIFEYRDYGSVASQVIDSWVIANHANETIQSLANDKIIDLVYSSTDGQYLDYNNILIDGEDAPETVREDYEFIWQGTTRYAFGDLNIGGASKTNFSLSHVSTGRREDGTAGVKIWVDGFGRTKPRWVAYVEIGISGQGAESFVKRSTGSGILFNFAKADENRTYAYVGSGELYTLNGAAESIGATPPEITTHLKISGTAKQNFIPNWNGSGSIPFTGYAVERRTDHYWTSGSLWSWAGGEEKRTYDYNPLSHAIFNYKDYGSVASQVIDSWVIANHASETIQSLANDKIIDLVYSSTGGQYLDYQNILIDGQDAPETITDDYEFIWQGTTRYAFGDLTIHGASKTNFSLGHISDGRREDGSPGVKIWTHGFGRTKPRWVAFIQTEITGQGLESATIRETGSGILYNFQYSAFARSFTYEARPSTLYTIGGASECAVFNTRPPSVDLKISGTAKQNFIPNWNGSGSVPFTGYAVERQTDHWTGSGSLWSWSGGEEVRTYDYNALSSHVIFEYRDYGLVSGAVLDSWVIANHANETIQSLADDKIIDLVYTTGSGQYLDYQNILIDGQDAPETVTEDYEFIWQGTTRYAFGDLNIGGASKTNFSLRHIGSGVLFSISKAITIFPRIYTGYATISVTGEAAPVVSYNETGSGSLFSIITGEEEITKDYVGSGGLFAMGGAAECVASIPPARTVDLKFTGVARTRFTPNWNSFGTIPVTGILTEKYGPHYHGKGVLWNINSVDERRVYDYNGSSIDFFDRRNYGQVSSPVIDSWVIANHANVVIETIKDEVIGDLVYTTGSGQYLDYGHIELPQPIAGLPGNLHQADITDDYQWVIAPDWDGTIYPFGGLSVSGVAHTPFTYGHTSVFDYESGRRADIQLDGIGIGRLPPYWNGTGYIYIGVDDKAHYNFSLLHPGDGHIQTDGDGTESRIYAPYIGSGRLYGFDGAVESTLVVSTASGHIVFSGAASIQSTIRYQGFGVISTLSGAAESATFSPDEEQMLFSFEGRRLSEKVTVREISSGVITLSGAGVETVTFVETFEGLVTLSGIATESIAPVYVGTGNISTLSGAAEAVTFNPEDLTTLFDIAGFGVQRVAYSPTGDGLLSIFGTSGDPLLTYAESGSGTITTSGDGHISISLGVIGEGAIFSSGFGGEARTIKLPPMREAHILFSGTAVERVAFDPAEDGTHVLLTGSGSERYIPNWIGSGTLPVYGQGLESHTEIFIGDGQIFSNGMGGESITVKVPAIQADLYFVGTRISEKRTVSEVGSGVLYNFSGASVTTTVSEFADGLFDIGGVGRISISLGVIGTGNISTFSGAAESITFNPEDKTTLFDITGRSTSRTTKSEVKRVEMQIGSTAEPVFFIPDYPGSGVISVFGNGGISVVRDLIGTGNISTLSGAAESFTYNPADITTLFDIAGIGVYRTTKSEVKRIETLISGAAHPVFFIPHWRGEGVIDVYGDAHASQTKVYTGSGSISTLSGAAESFTVNPPDQTTLFEYKGTRISEKTTVREIGEGRLWEWGTAGANITFAPKGDGLFRIDGFIEERITKHFHGEGVLWDFGNGDVRFSYAWAGSGVISVYGDAHASNTDVATGSGRISALSGGAEKTAFVPGTEVHTLSVTGEARVVITLSHVGSGSISTLSGAAESFTYNPADQTTLFDIAGRSVNRITKDYSVDDGLVTISGSAAESFSKAPYTGTGNITTADEAEERTTVAEEGSGSISTFSGAAECVAFSPDEENMLFSYNGRGHVLRTRAYDGQIEVLISGVAITNPPFGVHKGYGDVFIKGASSIEFVYAAPSRTYGWIV